MENYKNANGNSNVKTYSIGGDYIDVVFDGNSKVYRYSYKSAGSEKVEQMKKLAVQGWGLNSYINRYAREDYEK